MRLIRIILNGQPQETREGATVAELLGELSERLQTSRGACAVEVNRALVPRRDHALQRLNHGDEVEIVTLVGGG